MNNRSVTGKSLQPLIKKIWSAIGQKKMLEFFYTDKTKKEQGIRQIEPYLLGINKQGNIFVSGSTGAGQHKNYLLSQMEPGSVKTLPQTFNHLKVHRDKIYKTKETIILGVVYFPGEVKAYF